MRFYKMGFPFRSIFNYISGSSLLLAFSIVLSISGCQTFIPQQEPSAAGVSVQPTPTPLPRKSVAVTVPQFSEEVLKLQIFLDGRNFGPGIVDGRNGSFTQKAKLAYEGLHGSIPALDSIASYTSYKIREADLARIGKMAATPKQIAAQSNTPYTELIALVAERYHTSRAFLRERNPGVDFSQLRAGDSVYVPNVFVPFRIEDYKPTSKKEPDREPDPARKYRSVRVDIRNRLLEVLDSDKTIALFPITPGSEEFPASLGSWVIRGIVAMPWYRYDRGVLESGTRTENYFMLPPGPRNPVGILWAGLNKRAIGIHGTSSPETIGRSASHGCIRLSNWDAARFRDLVTVGNVVIIK